MDCCFVSLFKEDGDIKKLNFKQQIFQNNGTTHSHVETRVKYSARVTECVSVVVVGENTHPGWSRVLFLKPDESDVAMSIIVQRKREISNLPAN